MASPLFRSSLSSSSHRTTNLGDILVEVEGKPVPDSSTMLNLVAEVQPGKLALLKVVRNSNPVTVKLTVGKRPKPRALRGEAEE